MKYIWLGIKDYCKDVLHDWLANRMQKIQHDRIYTYDDKEDIICWVYPWKEGSLWYYIKQRKLAKEMKNV